MRQVSLATLLIQALADPAAKGATTAQDPPHAGPPLPSLCIDTSTLYAIFMYAYTATLTYVLLWQIAWNGVGSLAKGCIPHG